MLGLRELVTFAPKGLLSRPGRTLTTRRHPTGKNEPTPNERLPPRETRTKLRRTTSRPPPLHGQRNALEIEPSNPTLKTLPTNADQEMPAPSGPTDLKMLSHTSFLREHFQGGRAAGSAGRVGKPATPDGPKESCSLTLSLSGAKWQGAFQLLQ
jgi:hypothetical protein